MVDYDSKPVKHNGAQYVFQEGSPHTLCKLLVGSLGRFYERQIIENMPGKPHIEYVPPSEINLAALGPGKHSLDSRIQCTTSGKQRKLGHISINYYRKEVGTRIREDVDYPVSSAFAFEGGRSYHYFTLWFNTFRPGLKNSEIPKQRQQDRDGFMQQFRQGWLYT